MFGTRYPILLGGMAHVSRSPLVAAVSAAGGLGIIGSGGMPPEVLAEQIADVRRRTDKPFGVNLMLLDPNIKAQLEVVLRERVTMVTTGAGNPAPYIERLKEAGIKVFPVIPAVSLARRMERSGADGVIAEGTESGGHVGEVTTIVLVPQVVDAVSIPVIAAGGIADGRGLAAAIVLGAQGVQMGTRFLASAEAPAHENFKNAILKANERATLVTGRVLGAPVRTLVNKMSKQFALYEREGRPREEFEALAVGGLRRAVYDGDTETGSLMAGQISGMIDKIEPVETIITQMVATAAKLLPEEMLLLEGRL
ncbi:MAG TPA: enoyl-[acyl-carrier-protein] reductase FabK [Candidatus Acetothermia bacterium]|nr:enoyl-[acyl-carrier-protein] reductase FabK [Candidatus Acetothermia bacterium]